jgi:dual specificity phosphatase 12
MDHILDQTPEVVRPRTPSNFALPAPLSTLAPADDSAVDADGDAEDRPARARTTSVSDIINPLTGLPGRSRRESAAGVATPPTEGRPRSRSVLAEALTMSRQNGGIPSGGTTPGAPGRQILDADALAARLPPQLAALRSGGMMPTPEAPRRLSSGLAPMLPVSGPPIIANPKCSGYFVEPLTWMEPMLDGAVSGKLFCPNEKCKAKIGTYDWAGVQCGCREWVTPVSTGRETSMYGGHS